MPLGAYFVSEVHHDGGPDEPVGGIQDGCVGRDTIASTGRVTDGRGADAGRLVDVAVDVEAGARALRVERGEPLGQEFAPDVVTGDSPIQDAERGAVRDEHVEPGRDPLPRLREVRTATWEVERPIVEEGHPRRSPERETRGLVPGVLEEHGAGLTEAVARRLYRR